MDMYGGALGVMWSPGILLDGNGVAAEQVYLARAAERPAVVLVGEHPATETPTSCSRLSLLREGKWKAESSARLR
jgi:hypothetical protein